MHQTLNPGFTIPELMYRKLSWLRRIPAVLGTAGLCGPSYLRAEQMGCLHHFYCRELLTSEMTNPAPRSGSHLHTGKGCHGGLNALNE